MGTAGQSLAWSLKNSDAAEWVADVADTASSIASNETVLEGIPIAGSILRAIKGASEVKDILFQRKIIRILKETGTTSQQDRDEFYEYLMRENKIDEFGETVILLIDRVDHLEKATIIGRIMAANISRNIDYDTAIRICYMINNCYIGDLRFLKEAEEPLPSDIQYTAGTLLTSGLVTPKGMDSGNYNRADEPVFGPIYVKNKYSQALVKFGL